MQRNLPHIISQATSAPLLLEPAYARVFFCALGRESGINSLHIPGNNESLDQSDMALVTGDFMATGKPQARFYQVVNGIAVLPVTGTLVHKLGGMRPFSGMTGYDGVTARLQQAVSDPYSAANYLIPICILFDTDKKRATANYLIPNPPSFDGF